MQSLSISYDLIIRPNSPIFLKVVKVNDYLKIALRQRFLHFKFIYLHNLSLNSQYNIYKPPFLEQWLTVTTSDIPEVKEDLLVVIRSLNETEAVLESSNEALHDGADVAAAAIARTAISQAVLYLHRHRYQLLSSLYLHMCTKLIGSLKLYEKHTVN